MPVAWIFLAAMLLLGKLLSVRLISGAELQACLLFYRNFLGAGIVAGHFWSLSLEEQFYLVWPALLLILGIPRCRWIAISGALACATYRFVFWSMYDRHPLNDQTQVRADAILVGCLLAILLADPRVLRVASYFTRRVAIPALVVFAICLAHFHFLPPLIECVAAAVLLAVPVLHPEWRMTRALSFRPLCWLGVISYSVYVWQQCFLMAGPGFRVIAWCIVFPATVLASHYWIERPMTRLGHRAATGRSANERIGTPSAGRGRRDRDGECVTAGEPV
jgi:peptidoglycan/LPS O-acetylase OafA/YrhL